MRKNQIILIVIATISCIGLFGQSQIIVPIEGAIIVHQESVPTEDKILLSKIDSVNTSSLKRKSKLDSAAKHHAMYLAKYFLDHNTLSHKEEVDYPNFDEKINIGDRTGEGGKSRNSEICAFSTKREAIHGEPNVGELRKKVGNSWLTDHIQQATEKKEDFFFDGYKNSQRHWNILKDPEFKCFGSYTIFVCVYTKKGMDEFKNKVKDAIIKSGKAKSQERINELVEELGGGNIHYVTYVINVVVFSTSE